MIEKLKNVLAKDIYKNTITLLSGTVLAQVIPFLIYPLLARLYSPESFGIQSLYLTTVSLMAIIASFRLEYSLMLPPENENANRTAKTIISLVLFLSFIILFIITVVYLVVEKIYNYDFRYQWLFFVPFTLLSQLCITVTNNMLNRNEKFKQTAFIAVSQSLGSSSFRVILGFAGILSFGLIWGYVISQWIIVIWSLFRYSYIRIVHSIKDIRLVLTEYKQFLLFKTPHAFVNTLAVNLPVYILSFMAGNKEVGLFSVGLTLVQTPLNVIINSLYQVLYQKMSVMYHQKKSLFSFLKQYYKKTIMLAVPFFIVLFILSKCLIIIVFGKEWADAAVYLRIMLPYLCVYFLLGPLNFIPDIFSLQKKAMYIEFVFTFLRAFSMFVGIYLGNVIIGLMLFSLSGILIGLYSYIWYYQIVKNYNKQNDI